MVVLGYVYLCLCICYHSKGGIIHFYRYGQLHYGVLLDLNVWSFIKLLHTEVMASFTYHDSH